MPPGNCSLRTIERQFGAYADMVVLSADPRTVPPEQIAPAVRATLGRLRFIGGDTQKAP